MNSPYVDGCRPASRVRILFYDLSWGLHPRFYAYARFAGLFGEADALEQVLESGVVAQALEFGAHL